MRLVAWLGALLPLWGIAAQDPAQPAEITRAAELGRAFLAGEQQTFLELLESRGLAGEVRVEIAWEAEAGRWLVARLARTPAELQSMSEQEFQSHRRSWTASADAEWRRRHPLAGELRGYGGESARQRGLQGTRDVLEARDRGEYLRRIRDRVENGHVTILFVPRGGQGPCMYGFRVADVEALDEEQFQRWRARFVRWIEIHTPGQSQVTKFATATEAEFERMYRESKDRHGAHDITRALQRFEQRTGIELAYPRYQAQATGPVVAGVSGSTEQSGLLPGDTILAVEDAATLEWDECVCEVNAYEPGSTVALKIRRAAEPQPLRVLLHLPR